VAKVIYLCGVEWVIKTFDFYKVPGPDGIFPVLLKEGLNVLLGKSLKIKVVLRANIALRHVPLAWRGTKGVFLLKLLI